MSNKDTGGSAFPVQSVYIEDQETNSHGMTLRDYFAAKAMQSILSDPNYSSPDDKLAEASYWIADAMIKARE